MKNDGDFSKATMTAVPPHRNQEKIEQTKIVFHYCKKPGQVIRDCRKTMKKEQEQRNDPSLQNTKPSTSTLFAPCPRCQRTIHPPEKRWSCPNAAKRPKRLKQDHPADNRNEGQEQGNLTRSGPISIPKKPLKLEKPPLQCTEHTSVRQYVISDTLTI